MNSQTIADRDLFAKIKKSYWACDLCLKKAGGEPSEGVGTVMRGECAVCGITDTLIPWVDYNWPSDSNSSKFTEVNLK